MIQHALILGMAFASPLFAVTYDVALDPAKLAELAKRPEFQSVCQVNGASGVLIAPNTVLTAKHVVATREAKSWVKLAGKDRKIAKIVQHEQADLAVIVLVEKVDDITPTPLYRGDKEVGLLVWKIGFGVWAPLVEGHQKMLKPANGTPRAITNNIYEVTEDDVYYKFDKAGEGHTEYEGGTAPGDSGGPLYAKIGDDWQVVAVTSGPRNGFYADARVSTHAKWIDEAVAMPASLPTTQP